MNRNPKSFGSSDMTSRSDPLSHRSDIDGLRALAVVPVVLTHAGVPGISGGFTGVDIFFVVSGFLITKLLLREVELGRLSIAAFYNRRARRILPALFVMLAGTTAGAWFAFTPEELEAYSRSLAGAVLFGSNFVFYFQSGYFDAAAIEKPLLHTWSLGIEEQFYVLWPLMLGFLATSAKRSHFILLVILGALASFALNVWWIGERQNAAFYLFPPRAWELMVGAFLALHPFSPNQALKQALSLIGLILVVTGFIVIGPRTPFPGWPALLPVVGTALLLVGNETQSTWVARLLSRKPLIFIGLVSYSFYLWHYPLLSFGYYSEGRPQPLAANLGLIGVAFLFAVASYYWIELPFRRLANQPRAGARILRSGALGTAILLTVSWQIPSWGRSWTHDPAIGKARAAANGQSPSRKTCHVSELQPKIPAKLDCLLSGRSARYVALLGDSHADAIAPAIAQALKKSGIGFVQMSKSSCPPAQHITVSIERGVTSDSCARFNREAVVAIGADPNVAGVVLSSRWDYYSDTRGFGNDPDIRTYLTRGTARRHAADSSYAALRAGLSETILALRRARGAGFPILVVGPIPEVGFDVPKCIMRSRIFGRNPQNCARWSAIDVRSRRAGFDRLWRDLNSTDQALLLFEPQSILCDNRWCQTILGSDIMYRDSNHLSLVGNRHLVEALQSSIAWKTFIVPR